MSFVAQVPSNPVSRRRNIRVKIPRLEDVFEDLSQRVTYYSGIANTSLGMSILDITYPHGFLLGAVHRLYVHAIGSTRYLLNSDSHQGEVLTHKVLSNVYKQCIW